VHLSRSGILILHGFASIIKNVRDHVASTRADKRAVGEILQDIAGVSKEQIEQAVQVAKKSGLRTLEVLEANKAITEEEKQKTLARKWGMDYCDLGSMKIPDEVFDLVPEWLMKEHKVIPIELTAGVLTVGLTDPLNVRATDEIAAATGYEVRAVLVQESQMMRILQQRLGAGAKIDAKVVEGVVGQLESSVSVHVGAEKGAGDEDQSIELQLMDEAPIVRLVNAILIKGIGEGASDIHVQPESDGILVRYRVDGVLHDSTRVPKTLSAPVVARLKVMAGLDISEKRRPQDGRIDLALDNKHYELRVSVLPAVEGEKVMMRVHEQESAMVGLAKLGFSEAMLKQVEEAIVRPYGMILVVGPTGSGKSTTLYSILDRVNVPEKNIITVENPVEKDMDGLTQVDISHDRSPLTFASALRSILRQDPNIVMIGEIRDHETALIAAEASLTGHLVLSTLHTNDAPGTITRLIDMEVEPFLISSSLILIIAQRLVRKLCEGCRQPYEVDSETLSKLGFMAPVDIKEKIRVFKSKPGGCSLCLGRGYKGRTGVFEVLQVSDRIRMMTLKRASSMEIRAAAREEGMVPMLQDALSKILQGVTSIEESLRVVDIQTG